MSRFLVRWAWELPGIVELHAGVWESPLSGEHYILQKPSSDAKLKYLSIEEF